MKVTGPNPEPKLFGQLPLANFFCLVSDPNSVMLKLSHQGAIMVMETGELTVFATPEAPIHRLVPTYNVVDMAILSTLPVGTTFTALNGQFPQDTLLKTSVGVVFLANGQLCDIPASTPVFNVNAGQFTSDMTVTEVVDDIMDWDDDPVDFDQPSDISDEEIADMADEVTTCGDAAAQRVDCVAFDTDPEVKQTGLEIARAIRRETAAGENNGKA